MKSRYRFKLSVILFFAFFTFQLFAQDKPKDELFLLHQDVIKVDKVGQYEESIKELFGLWKKHGMEITIKHASKTDDNRYNFLSPLGSYADLDKNDEHWANLAKKAGSESLSKIFKSMDETYVSHKNTIIKKNIDLSYWPENSRMKGEKAEFLHFDHYYFKEGKINDAMKMMKEFKEMMAEKKSNDAWTVWTSDIGGDIGHVVVVRWAKDNVDYYQASNKRWASMEEEMKEMWPKFSATIKHFEHNNGKPMPEFTYKPGKE